MTTYWSPWKQPDGVEYQPTGGGGFTVQGVRLSPLQARVLASFGPRLSGPDDWRQSFQKIASASNIADELCASPSHVGRALGQLFKLGLVNRRQSGGQNYWDVTMWQTSAGICPILVARWMNTWYTDLAELAPMSVAERNRTIPTKGDAA